MLLGDDKIPRINYTDDMSDERNKAHELSHIEFQAQQKRQTESTRLRAREGMKNRGENEVENSNFTAGEAKETAKDV